MLPVIAALMESGLGLLANAVLVKGKEFVESKTGVKLEPGLSEEDLLKLKQFQLENETELCNMQLEDNRLTAEFLGKALDAQQAESTNITTRWAADVTGDVVTKRIRPAVLAYLLLLITGFAIADACGVSVNMSYVQLFSDLLELVFTAYFGGRSVEKIAEMYYNHKVAIGGSK